MSAGHPRPRFSIVAAAFDVAPYLPRFIESLERQRFDASRIQVVVVDDGSTDGSAEILAEWADQHADHATGLVVQVVRQPNLGQGAARNTGLGRATGEWVCFADPDDFLDRDYLAAADRFVDAHPDVDLVVTHPVVYVEDEDRCVDSHPLTWRFAQGDRLVDLADEPDFFQLFASSAFLRLDDLRAKGLEFDPEIRPNFEDGHLLARYLVRRERPTLGLVDTARYYYRRRSDGSSAIQTAWTTVDKFTTVLRAGHLAALDDAVDQLGHVPGWLQSMIIYELNWYLRNEEMMFGGPTAETFGVAAEYHALFARIVAHLEPERVLGFAGLALPAGRRQILAHGYTERPWCSEVVVDQVDRPRDRLKLVYRFTGAAPTEQLSVAGEPVDPIAARWRPLVYSGRTLLTERLVWVPRTGSELRINDGVVVPQRDWNGSDRPLRSRSVPARPGARRVARAAMNLGLGLLARLPPVRRRFTGAWILMDRQANAHDNAEHLFDWLRSNRRDVNAWFVVGRRTSAWSALRRRGVDRVLAYGSLAWRLACVNARFIVSSHADGYVYDPDQLKSRWTQPQWRFIWLQHGVTKDDLSRWLVRKPIALMLTTTRAEHESIVADGTPYRLTRAEVARTGMPRLDRLAELGRTLAPTTITIMPTWREYLLGKQLPGRHGRALLRDFAATPYAVAWREVLRSPRLRELADAAGLSVLFMPHPNIQPYLDEFDVPAWVRRGSYADLDVQRVIAESAVLVTDYSSVAFDAAFIRRPVTYFQFDADQVFGGEHITRPGYFDYGRDGFGPVVTDSSALIDAVSSAIADPTRYADRADQTFDRDEPEACRRAVAAIEELLGRGAQREV